MSFAKPIHPVARLRELVEPGKLAAQHNIAINVILDAKDANNNGALAVYVFDPMQLDILMDKIIERTYEETKNMIMRRLNWDKMD